MPRIILKSNYLKATRKKVSGFLKYIATREGVVKFTSDNKLLPATQKQKDTIEKMLAEVPDSKSLFEYEDYTTNPTRENASAFLSACADYYLLNPKHQNPELYARYIATRPNCEKVNTHGLFGMSDNISLKNAMAELDEHQGNVWTHIVSLRREDAQRLGYNDVSSWQSLVRSHCVEIAKQTKIKPHNLKWYGAFHNESHHPHIHLIVYSTDDKEGYLNKIGISSLRSAFAKTIFKQDLVSIYKQQTTARDDLKIELQEALAELEHQMLGGDLTREPLKGMFLTLVEIVAKRTKGKHVYGFLPKALKKQVDEILDCFGEDEKIAKCYEEWSSLRQQVHQTYHDKKLELLPLSQQKEFQHLKNIILKSALEFTYPVPPSHPIILERGSPENLEVEQDDTKAIEYYLKIADKNPHAAYRLGKLIIDSDNLSVEPSLGIYWLEKSAEMDHINAWNLLGHHYIAGELVKQDVDKALFYLHKSAQRHSSYGLYQLAKLYLYGIGVEKNEAEGMEFLLQSTGLGNESAVNLLEHYQTPKLKTAYQSILHSFLSVFSTPPVNANSGKQMSMIDRKQRSKMKRKKIALGHSKEDEMSMKD